MENWEAFSNLAQNLTVIAVVAGFLWLILSDKYIWTKSRGMEWKTRALEAESRAREAELELRQNTETLKELASRVEQGNQTQARILEALLERQRPQ